MPATVFVFGTLKQGFPNFAINRGRRLPGVFKTRDRLPLYLVGERCTPWLIDAPGQGEQVHGEIYEVDDAALAAMDALERVHEPDGYVRKEIDVMPASDGHGAPRQVQAYLKRPEALGPDDVRAGPLADYTLAHAALYRRRPG